MARNFSRTEISRTRLDGPHTFDRPYTLAAPPFESDDADLILRTQDYVEFYVHGRTLQNASSLPDKIQRLREARTREFARGTWEPGIDLATRRPIAYVAEKSDVLDLLLRQVYLPGSSLQLPQDVLMAFSVREAASKYGFQSAENTARRWISMFGEKDPVLVYAMAVKHKLPVEAALAAKASLGHDIQLTRLYARQQVSDLPVSAYHKLYSFRISCAETALTLIHDLTWMKEITRPQNWKPCFLNCSDGPGSCRKSGDRAKWFKFYLSIVEKALQTDPRSKTMNYMAVTGNALAQQWGCSSCRARAADDLQKFNKLLGQELRKMVDDRQFEGV